MTSFNLLGQEIALSSDAEAYNAIRTKYKSAALAAVTSFEADYAKCFPDMDALINGIDDYAVQVIQSATNVAVTDMVSLGIYLDDQAFLEKYLPARIQWDEDSEGVKDRYAQIVFDETQLKQYRSDRKEGRGRFVGGGLGLSGAIRGSINAGALNIATGAMHAIFNSVANAMTEAEAQKRKVALYAARQTREELTTGIFNCYFLVHLALIDAINAESELRIPAGPDAESCELARRRFSILSKGQAPESQVDGLIVDIVRLNPYFDEIYDYCCGNRPNALPELGAIADYFGVDVVEQRKALEVQGLIAACRRDGTAAVDVIAQTQELARRIGYASIDEVLSEVRSSAIREKASSLSWESPDRIDESASQLTAFADQIGASPASAQAVVQQARDAFDVEQRTFDGVEYASVFNAAYAREESGTLREALGRRGLLWMHECAYNRRKVFRAAKIVVEGTAGMKVTRLDEVAGLLEGKSGVSLLSWGEAFKIQVGGEDGAPSSVLLIQSDSRSGAGANKNEALINKLAEQVLRLLEKFAHEWK